MEKTTLATSQTKRSSPSSSREDLNPRTKQRVSDDKASVGEKSVEEKRVEEGDEEEGVEEKIEDDDKASVGEKSVEEKRVEEGVEEKIEELQTIVPGGTKLDDVDELFEETRSYVLALPAQGNTIRDVTDILDGFEYEDDKKLGA